MKNKLNTVSLLMAGTLLLGGCEGLSQLTDNHYESAFGGGDLVANTSQTSVHLQKLIDPEGKSIAIYKKAQNEQPLLPDWPALNELDKTSYAFRAFYQNSTNQKIDRNRIQDALLAESERRCSNFKQIIHRLQSNWQFATGAASTVSGIVGALADASANWWAGASGIFGGVRAEGNQAYYQNLASQVIIDGIDLRRAKLRKEIIEEGQSKSIDEYSLEGAVRDVIFYHASCHVITGFQEAQEAIKTVENPGLEMAKRIMMEQAVLTAIQDAGGDLDKLMEIQNKQVDIGLMEVGVPKGSNFVNPYAEIYNPVLFLFNSEGRIKSAFKQAELQIAELANDKKLVNEADKVVFDALQEKLIGYSQTYKFAADNHSKTYDDINKEIKDAYSAFMLTPNEAKGIPRLQLESVMSRARIDTVKIAEVATPVLNKIEETVTKLSLAVQAAEKDKTKIQTAITEAQGVFEEASKVMMPTPEENQEEQTAEEQAQNGQTPPAEGAPTQEVEVGQPIAAPS